MSSSQTKENVYTIFSEEIMTQFILDSMNMNNTLIFYDHYHSIFNLETKLLSKWKIVKPYIHLMFRTSSEELSFNIFERKLLKCGERNNSRFLLIQLTEKKNIRHHTKLIELEVHLVDVDYQYLNCIISVLKVLILRILIELMARCSN